MDDCHLYLRKSHRDAMDHLKTHRDANFQLHRDGERPLDEVHGLDHRDRLGDSVLGLEDGLHQEVAESVDRLRNGAGHPEVAESVDRSGSSVVDGPGAASEKSEALISGPLGPRERCHAVVRRGRAEEVDDLELGGGARSPCSPDGFSPLDVLLLAPLARRGARKDSSARQPGGSRWGLDVAVEGPRFRWSREDPRARV